MVGFGRLFFLLLLGTVFVVIGVELLQEQTGSGSWGVSESGRGAASRSSEDQPLLQHRFTTDWPVPLQTPHDTNMTENNVSRRRRRSSSSADTEDSVLPPAFLTDAHLSALRDLVSDKKITVRLGLRVSFSGPSELLESQLLLYLNKEPGLYNIGGKAGVFSMRIVGIKRLTSAP